MPNRWDVIIVGGGMAGVTAFGTLKENEPGKRILVVNGEDRIPYKRTKISKFIASGFGKDDFALHSPDHYSNTGSAILNGIGATAIESVDRSVTLSDGTTHSYDVCILAPGAAPVRNPVWNERVVTVRSASDGERLRTAAGDSKTAIVLGTGILGIEIAYQLSLLKLDVSVVGKAPRPMTKELDAGASDLLTSCMTGRGIQISNGVAVEQVTEDSDRRLCVSGSGKSLSADMVAACVGTKPDLGLARAAGLEVNSGIVVDWDMRTSVDGIYAAGDAIELPDGTVPHLWHQAEATGEIAGLTASGRKAEFANPAFRTKCEVFDHYFFSCGIVSDDAADSVPITDDAPYRSFRFKGDRCIGIVMVDDEANAKVYEQAVRERWSRDQIDARFRMM